MSVSWNILKIIVLSSRLPRLWLLRLLSSLIWSRVVSWEYSVSISSSSLRIETERSTLSLIPIYQTTWCTPPEIILFSNDTSAKCAIIPDSKEACEDLQFTDKFQPLGRLKLQALLNVRSSNNSSPRKMLKHNTPIWTLPSTGNDVTLHMARMGNLVCTKDINPLIQAHNSVVRGLKAHQIHRRGGFVITSLSYTQIALHCNALTCVAAYTKYCLPDCVGRYKSFNVVEKLSSFSTLQIHP